MVNDYFVALPLNGRVRLGRSAAERQSEIANRHDERAKLHRTLRAEILVGEQAADERRQIDQRGITAVKAGRLLVRKKEMLGQVEREQRPHAVIAEAFPHLRGEQAGKLSRMAEPGGLLFRMHSI